MNRTDPFYGYSLLLKTIVYVLVPLFLGLQMARIRRALHVFQLEGYKRKRFLEWCRANPKRAWFMKRMTSKKPLVMTGRAWRILVTSVILNVLGVLVIPGIAHLIGGWPYDLGLWAAMTGLLFYAIRWTVLLSDVLLSPFQSFVNSRYLDSARRRLAEVSPAVIGVTGSFGKTSTKFAIEGLLGPAGTVLATPGSYNTPLGVCRTINESLKNSHDYFVVEMGAYGRTEIAELCRFVRPRVGVLTAIGPAHLERFGDLDNVRLAKYEIIEALPPDGVAVMNTDDAEVRALADRTEGVGLRRYGLRPEGYPDVTATDVEITSSGTRFTILAGGESVTVQTRLLGRHAIGHVLAAVAVATSLGRSVSELQGPIEALKPVEHRLQIVEGTGGVTVIDDAYNSNPEGAAAALEVLAAIPGRRKVVVTPGIIELGPLQESANRRFGEQAAAVADTLIVVAHVNREAIVAGARPDRTDVVAVDSLAAAQEKLSQILQRGDVVLFENDLPDQYEN
ncbi:MAG: UDP-N-acetylmuramoyl-tripeptide--D-alanyl-D-alanine ligase [Actinomycetota bacterium]|nr:UDP-N-acetylmuramoyl-tripeptide--D-alanyl-D-alanine ligase [Actinomycetota bacterium]